MRYRIKEYQYYNSKRYEIQRKSIFGFWYNPDNNDAYTTGSYDSIAEAKDMFAARCDLLRTSGNRILAAGEGCRRDDRQ